MTPFTQIVRTFLLTFLFVTPLLASTADDSIENRIKKLSVIDWSKNIQDDSADYLLENMDLINHLDDHYSNLLNPNENDSKENNRTRARSPFSMHLGDCTEILPATGDKLVLELERNSAYIFPAGKSYEKDEVVELVRLFAVLIQQRRDFATCAIVHADTFFSKDVRIDDRIKGLNSLITLEEEYVQAYLRGYNCATVHFMKIGYQFNRWAGL